MKSKNTAFENSLACLQHPLTLLSIAILLLNDHVLKVVSPSWLTGKLSDFAGLFFFPFIVAAGLSLALSKFDLSRQRIGQIAFGLVAVWFVLLKTVPFVNSLTAQFASLFIGAPARLVLDPTDLIALIVLLPAWRVWSNLSKTVALRKAYVSLVVGVIACLASSPKLPPFDSVRALEYQNGILYAESAYDGLVKSTDGGNSWNWLDYQKDEIESIYGMFSNRELPIQACDPIQRQTCYMVDGTPIVSISNDKGKSWQIAWEIPPDRREYVIHVSENITTQDLIIVDESDSRYLFIAMGKHGILRRQLPDGDWIQLGVEEAQPTPFYAPNILSAINNTGKELAIWLGVAFLALLITHVAIWIKFTADKKVINLLGWIYFTFNFAMVFIIVELLIVFAVSLLLDLFPLSPQLIPLHLDEPFGLFAIVLAISTLLVWLLMRTNKWVLKIAVDQNARSRVVLYCAFTLIGVLLFGYLPWPLWALGIIERYQLTLTISILASGLITATGYYLIRNAK
jgi:hypothetical protein